MKPKFLEIIRLAVLLIAVGAVVGTVMHSHASCKAAVESVGYAMQASDAPAGPLGWIWGWFTWFTYLFFVGCVTLVAVLVLHALGVFAMLVSKLAEGMLWLRHAWSPSPLPIDTVISTSKSGAPITLGQILDAMNVSIRELKAKTAGLEPPPPPKSASEVAAEKDAEIAAMRKQMAELQQAIKQQAAVSKAPVPTTGGA